MEEESQVDAVVLGGGISGLATVAKLLEQGKKVALIDEFRSLGGNHVSVHLDRYTYDIGSFFFSEKSKLFDIYPEIKELYKEAYCSAGRVCPDLDIRAYPIDKKGDVFSMRPSELLRTALSVLWARVFCDPRKSVVHNVRYWIGDYFMRRTGLYEYLVRFLGADPSEVDATLAEKRMGWVRANAKLRTILPRPKKAHRPHLFLLRPKSGFEVVYARIGDSLRARGVRVMLATKVERIEGDALTGFRLSVGKEVIRAGEIVSTIPLRDISRMLEGTDAPDIKYTSLVTLFYSFDGNRKFRHNVLYNFSKLGRWKRLTMHSDYYEKENGREYFSLENITRSIVDPDVLDSDFRNMSREAGIFDGDLRLEGWHATEMAYPLYEHGAREAADRFIASLKDRGIRSFGRQGGFDYQPTAGVSIDAAFGALDVIG